MKRTKVKIEKETKKAYLIVDGEGRKGWIQKRWLSDESTVNPKTFEKSVKEFASRQKASDDYHAWANSNHKVVSVGIAAGALMDFHNATLGIPFQETAKRVKAAEVRKLTGGFDKGTCPAGTKILVAGADYHKTRTRGIVTIP